VRLPGEVPNVSLGLDATKMTALAPHLNAVVIRPDLDEVVMTWCASAPAQREFSADQALAISREIHWQRGV
jgi:hypothetical protein